MVLLYICLVWRKLKDKAEKYACKHHRKDFEDYKKKYRQETGPVKGNRIND